MEGDIPTVEEEEPRAADGRVPGRRGRATRQRLLECTSEMLRTTSYRDLKVVDIAKEAGTSPATFYQYFPDVEAAIHVLAEEMALQGPHLAVLVEKNRWRGRSGYEGAEELADQFLRFWDEHRSVLRVVDLATSEGDNRFSSIRTRLLNALNNALTSAITEMKRAGRHPEDLSPDATAGVLVAMLAHVASHQYGFEFWGVRTADLRTSMARIIFTAVSGQRPPG